MLARGATHDDDAATSISSHIQAPHLRREQEPQGTEDHATNDETGDEAVIVATALSPVQVGRSVMSHKKALSTLRLTLT